MGDYYSMGWGTGFGFGWIFMLVFWGLVIWAIFALVRGASGGGGGSYHGKSEKGEKSAIDILNERYAKGEVSKEDFDRMKKDLQ